VDHLIIGKPNHLWIKEHIDLVYLLTGIVFV